jgi:hypothetical protein
MTPKRTFFTIESLAELTSAHEPPCLSLYQPTHRRHPENQQDPIRFRNLMKELDVSLRQKYPAVETRLLLEPFAALANDPDFWNHTLDGWPCWADQACFKCSGFCVRSPNWLSRPTAFTPSPCDAFCNRLIATRFWV